MALSIFAVNLMGKDVIKLPTNENVQKVEKIILMGFYNKLDMETNIIEVAQEMS